MKKGILFVVSGPSGVGKGTVIKEVISKKTDMAFSISATTRAPREGEVDGDHYFFISKDEFLKKIENDEFLEWSQHFDQYYGTLKSHVYEKLDSGKDIILDIEVNGAGTLIEKKTEAVYIFMKPPSLEVLKDRLMKRNSEQTEQIKKRLERAEWEMSFFAKYDYILINDVLEKCIYDLESIINAEHCKNKR